MKRMRWMASAGSGRPVAGSIEGSIPDFYDGNELGADLKRGISWLIPREEGLLELEYSANVGAYRRNGSE